MDFHKKKEISQMGGFARVRLYGNPGTVEGRKRGGKNAIKIHRRIPSAFKTLRHVDFPCLSTDLAEAFGILAGDGHVGEYQTTVTTHAITDIEHAQYVQRLFKKLFSIPVGLHYKKSKACVIVISSKEVSRFFVARGLVQGNKVRAQLAMPLWVKKNESYRLSFIKGLFDTDGCVYVDTHRIRGRTYKNMGMAFANRSAPLLHAFADTLTSLGLRPTQKSKYRVFLRRKADIVRYFDMVGSSNPKHIRKMRAYLLSGGVPKRS